ncbi:MAG TPA: histidine kinase, partial [Negativicutes bacterium]|nr:histidine kinase [Negativicutes bacterium]
MFHRLRRPEKLLSPELEQEYRVACWRRDIYAGIICLAVCAMLLLQALWNDAIIIKLQNSDVFPPPASVASLLFFLRTFSIIYTLALGAWLFRNRRNPSFVAYDILVFIWLFLNTSLIILSETTRPVWYYAGSISQAACVMMLYLVLPQHNLFLRTLPPLLFTVSYFYLYANFKQPPADLGFAALYAGFVIVNILGIIYSHMSHTVDRRRFILSMEKDRLVTLLEQKNRELEREKELVARYEAELRKREVQREKLRTLQAQIKPHFLYNTLSTIAYYCRSQPDQAYKLIGDLSVYLQGAFKLRDEQVEWSNELQLVRAYLAIESSRMEERLTVQIDVQGDFFNCRLPPFTIQPLVENAVRHGLAPLVKGGILKVIAREEANGYYFEVSDDGVGIALEKQIDLLAPRDSDDNIGIGLVNVHERLQGLFDSGLCIDSQPGAGTSVHFSIAKRKA